MRVHRNAKTSAYQRALLIHRVGLHVAVDDATRLAYVEVLAAEECRRLRGGLSPPRRR
jgi:hypothetical protein